MIGKKRLGEMLIDAGIIDETQLKAALGHQRQWGVRIGQALVDLKLASEADIVRALAQKFGYDVARLDGLEAYGLEQALGLLPRDFALHNNVFPMAADTQTVTVAMSDPTNLAVVDEIRFRTGRRVKVCIGGDRELAEALRQHYPGDEAVEAIALDLDADEGQAEAVFDPFGGGSKDALDAFFGGTEPAPASPSASAHPAPASAPAPAPAERAAPAPAARPLRPAAAPPGAAPSRPPAPLASPAARPPGPAQPRPPAGAVPPPPARGAQPLPPPAPTAPPGPRIDGARGAGAPMPAPPAARPAAPSPLPPPPDEEPVLATDLVEAAGGGGSERELTTREIEILEALDRLAGGGHAEPEIVKPTQAMAAVIRLLLRKRVMTEQEFLDELARR